MIVVRFVCSLILVSVYLFSGKMFCVVSVGWCIVVVLLIVFGWLYEFGYGNKKMYLVV
jgi:hypothetical protein